MTAPGRAALAPLASAKDPALETRIFPWRNELAGLPLLPAWLAMSEAPAAAALAAAFALVGLGAALRAWSTLHNAYARGTGRKTLVTGGPYSWLRNPLYVGNALVLLGGFVASAQWAWLLLALPWLAGVYTLTVRHEERRLLEKYGDAYADYCARVPRWLPRRVGERPRLLAARFLVSFGCEAPCFLVVVPFALRHAFS